MPDPSLDLSEQLLQEQVPRGASCGGKVVTAFSLLISLCLAVLSQCTVGEGGHHQDLAAQAPTITMAMQHMQAAIAKQYPHQTMTWQQARLWQSMQPATIWQSMKPARTHQPLVNVVSPALSNIAASTVLADDKKTEEVTEQNPLRVLIVGAGVGGLALADSLVKDPKMHVTVLEKTDKFKRFGGPIQLASNALQVIKEMDNVIFDKIMEKFTFTGNLKNGIKDGIRTEWFIPFDLASPAEARNMSYTGVIERPDLQEIYLDALPPGVVQNGDGIARYETNPNGNGVKAIMQSGAVVDGDVLIGADGIWSTVRATMWDTPVRGEGSGVSYSGYTCFAGELKYDSPDNGQVGYKVYIGPGQYFVVSDIGKGRYQWYAFLAREEGSSEKEPKPDGQIPYLKNVFKGWSPELHAILDATKENEIGQRDLYDLPPPVLKPWTAGNAALLGDSVHAMMPNLGQGGCQAIEDAFVISQELKSVQTRGEIPSKLKRYVDRRQIRSAAVHGLSRLASDLVINTFGTPVKVSFEGALKVENFDYLGVVTRCWQPILPQFFKIQWGFLYECWRNEAAIDLNVFLGLLLVSILLDPLGLVPFVGIN